MKFLTPCFVHFKDSVERDQLLKWCIYLGYYYIEPPKEEELGDKVICDESCVGIAHDPASFTDSSCIDCGNNISLFCALSAMNNENAREQWFIAKEDIPDFRDSKDIIYKKGAMIFNRKENPLPSEHFCKASVKDIIDYLGEGLTTKDIKSITINMVDKENNKYTAIIPEESFSLIAPIAKFTKINED